MAAYNGDQEVKWPITKQECHNKQGPDGHPFFNCVPGFAEPGPRVATGDHIVVPEGEVSLNRNISCHSSSNSRVKLLFQVVFIIFPKALESLAK